MEMTKFDPIRDQIFSNPIEINLKSKKNNI
jgi:hypothetical protein